MAEQPHDEKVGFPESQFMAKGLDGLTALSLAVLYRKGQHIEAAKLIATFPHPLNQEIATIYQRCIGINS